MTPRASSSSKPYRPLESKRVSTVLKRPSKNVSIGARTHAVLCTQKNAELAVCPLEVENLWFMLHKEARWGPDRKQGCTCEYEVGFKTNDPPVMVACDGNPNTREAEKGGV